MKAKFFLFTSFFSFFTSYLFSQYTWTKKEDFPGSSRNFAVSFSIGNKGYYGLGQKRLEVFTYKVYNDFWEYDSEKNIWTQKAEFPKARLGVKGFSLNGKGYAGFGYFIAAYGPNAGGNDYQPDFYEFIPDSNKWFKKSDSYLADRDICFVLNDTACSVNPEYRILKKYNPATDAWTEYEWGKKVLAPSYSDIRGSNIAFSVGGKEYIIATTLRKKVCTNQLWEFNARSLAWIKRNDLPINGSDTLCAFSVRDKVFVLCGKTTLLQYDPYSDSWEKKTEPLPQKYFSPLFALNGKHYFIYQHEVWEFTP